MAEPDPQAFPRHGLSRAKARQLRAEAGKCALCGGEPETLDHCHATGWTRDALCQGCNLALGHLESRMSRVGTGWVEDAIGYVRFHRLQAAGLAWTDEPPTLQELLDAEDW